MTSPYRLDTLYSERYCKEDLYRLMRSIATDPSAKAIIIPLNIEGTQCCMMLDSENRRETLVSTGWSNQILVRPAFHWRISCSMFKIKCFERTEVPPTRQPSDLYAVARRAL